MGTPDSSRTVRGVYNGIREILYYSLGVPTFFFISGFLIWISLMKQTTVRKYFYNRFLRIYPELWVGVSVEIITIIILYRGIDWIRLAMFAITQGTVLQFWTPEFLRGYGCGTPNGTLWTICITIQFYILVWFIKKIHAIVRNKFVFGLYLHLQHYLLE